jgi:hypothetical protein
MNDKPEIGTVLYRYEDHWNYLESEYRLSEWTVTSHTHCGLRIKQRGGWGPKSEKWMRWPAVRPFARLTKEEALEAWKIRKYREFDHCERKLELARRKVCSFDPDHEKNRPF